MTPQTKDAPRPRGAPQNPNSIQTNFSAALQAWQILRARGVVRGGPVAMADGSPDELSFEHVFSPQVRCTLTAPARAPVPGTLRPVTCEWVGRPKPKHAAECKHWMLSVYQKLAQRWNQRLIYAHGLSPTRTELWSVEPGQAPTLIETIPFGIG